jgi:heme exporter protein A
VAENLDFWAAYLGGSGAPGALQKLGLAKLASLPAGYLSAGQRRRLALARLVAIRRRIWLLDEPANNLDVGAQARLTALMNAHLRGGGIVVAAAHQPIGLRRARTLRLGPA